MFFSVVCLPPLPRAPTLFQHPLAFYDRILFCCADVSFFLWTPCFPKAENLFQDVPHAPTPFVPLLNPFFLFLRPLPEEPGGCVSAFRITTHEFSAAHAFQLPICTFTLFYFAPTHMSRPSPAFVSQVNFIGLRLFPKEFFCFGLLLAVTRPILSALMRFCFSLFGRR